MKGEGAEPYSALTVLAAEGARVGIKTCLRCGAAILIDPRDKAKDDPVAIHRRWHERSP